MEDTVKAAALPNVHTITTSINNNDNTTPESPSHNRNIMISLPSMQTSNEIKEATPPPHRYKGLSVAIAYGLVSMCAVVVNKAVLSSWSFQFPLTMIASQMAISFLLLWVLKQCELIQYDDWSLATAKKVWPMALAHVGNVLLGLAALNLVDIPMFGALRRTSVIFVLVMEYLVLSKTASLQVIGSTLLLLLGAIVGGWGDLHFDPFGYALTFCVNVTTALTLVLIPKLGTAANLNAFGLMLYQITISFPIVVFFIFSTGEWNGVMAYPFLHHPGFQFAFFVSSAQIFLVNYTLFLCTQLNSPLTTTVTGTIKNIGETMLGFVFFSVPVDPINLMGIAIGFTGSVYYSVVKYFEQQQTQSKPALAKV
jgi:solute carrier family 35 protein